MERTGNKRNSSSAGVPGEEPNRKRTLNSSNTEYFQLERTMHDDTCEDVAFATPSTTEHSKLVGDFFDWTALDTADHSTVTERIPSPLPLFRAPLGSHMYNTFSSGTGNGATNTSGDVATVIQQRRAKELEDLLEQLCRDGSSPTEGVAAPSSSSLFDDDCGDNNTSPVPLDDFSSMNLAFFSETITPGKEAAVLDTALTSRIENAVHGFSIQNAMRLKDNVVALFRMTERPSAATKGDSKSPRAGSIVSTPHGLAMLLIPHDVQQSTKISPNSKHKRWTQDEDELLTYAIQDLAGDSKMHPWIEIAATYFDGMRSAKQCKRRWDTIKGKVSYFSKAEDDLLLAGWSRGLSFSAISSQLQGRSTEQVRARFELIDPHKKRIAWTEDEELVLTTAQNELGNQWKEISNRLPGRSTQDVKNHWYNRKKLTKTLQRANDNTTI